MKIYLYLTLLILSIYSLSATATDKSNTSTEYKYIAAKSGLNFRTEPKGAILGKLDYGKRVTITEHSKVFETIKDGKESKKGEWVGVKVEDTTVYVFDAYLAKEQPEDYEILLPSSYRIWEQINPTAFLNEDWLDLYINNGKYFLGKANYSIEHSEDGCTGLDVKTIASKNDTLLYINGDLPLGKINNLIIKKDSIWPKEAISFYYKENNYILRAEGEILSSHETLTDEGPDFYHEIKNYKLYLTKNKEPESLLLEQAYFEQTFVKLLFVGDIDSDSTLDFIFETNRHYEETRVFLYLSSTATKNEKYHMSKISIGFDC